jgi:hypothetical protein
VIEGLRNATGPAGRVAGPADSVVTPGIFAPTWFDLIYFEDLARVKNRPLPLGVWA